ncbi:MAG: hypothetical protein GX777_00650, partial [Fastidiosipila sp.]|nr:hypothetical protein [Fastidiosipila sp.]
MKKNIIKSLLSLILSVSMLVTGLGLTVHASVSEELGGQTEAGVSTEIPAPIKGKPQGEQADGLQDPEAGEIEEAGLSGLSTGPEVSGGQFGRLGLREVVSQDRLTDLVATVKQDGNLIDTGATITSTKPIRVDFSFGVPVKGDDPSPTNPIQHGDTVTFEISSAFELTSFNVIELKKDGETVGHAAFTTDPNTNMVTATVTFDGKEQIFTDNSYSKVKVSFGGEFTYDSSGASGNPGGHTVTILEKEYTVNVPDAPIVYDVTKSGEANLKDQSIEWTVNISATQNGQSLDLAGYKFSDNLKDVGNYIKNSFKVATSEPTPEWNETTKELSYVLLPNSISPQTITFKTAIPDDMYYATGQQTIGNTAKLLDSTSLPITEGAGSATFTPEWITKTGATNDDVNVVEYHPENRTITWTITANQYAAKLYNVIITDVLPEGLELASA